MNDPYLQDVLTLVAIEHGHAPSQTTVTVMCGVCSHPSHAGPCVATNTKAGLPLACAHLVATAATDPTFQSLAISPVVPVLPPLDADRLTQLRAWLGDMKDHGTRLPAACCAGYRILATGNPAAPAAKCGRVGCTVCGGI